VSLSFLNLFPLLVLVVPTFPPSFGRLPCRFYGRRVERIMTVLFPRPPLSMVATVVRRRPLLVVSLTSLQRHFRVTRRSARVRPPRLLSLLFRVFGIHGHLPKCLFWTAFGPRSSPTRCPTLCIYRLSQLGFDLCECDEKVMAVFSPLGTPPFGRFCCFRHPPLSLICLRPVCAADRWYFSLFGMRWLRPFYAISRSFFYSAPGFSPTLQRPWGDYTDGVDAAGIE